MCFFKVTNFIADGISQHGVARNLENICSKVFLKENGNVWHDPASICRSCSAPMPALVLPGPLPSSALCFLCLSRHSALLFVFVICVHMIALLAC